MTINLSQRASELSLRLEELQARCTDNPANAPEILSDALEGLQKSLDELSAADEELIRQNEELVQAQSKLAESESILHSFFDSPGVMRGIVEVVGEDDVRHIEVNEATAGFLGLTPEAMRGKLGSELGESEEALRSWVDHYRQSQRTGKPVSFEHPNSRGDSEAWLYATVSHLGMTSEGRQRFAYVLIDITEHKQAEKALQDAKEELAVSAEELRLQNEELISSQLSLQESEEKYRSLFHNLNSAAVLIEPIFDGDGRLFDLRYLMANPSVKRHLGKTPDELVGKLYSEVFPYPGWNPVFEIYERVLSSGKPVKGEIFLPALNKHFDISIYRPTIGRLALVLADITERKQAEAEQRESERRERERAEELAVMLDAVPTPVIIARDPECTHMIGNRAANELLRLPSGGEISLTAPLERRPHHYKAVKEGRELGLEELPIRRAAKGENVQGFEYTLVFDDGTTRELVANGMPLRDGKGTFRGAVHTLVDITERKKAEEQILQSQKTFSELVERAPFGIYIVDSQFRIAQMNSSSQKGAFRNVRPLIGRSFNEAMHILWPDEVAEEIISHFRHTLDTGEPYHSPKFINPRHDEKIVESYEWELHRMTLPDGQFGVICYYFNSTKMRQAEEALLESEMLLSSITENTPDPIFLKDRECRIVLANPATLQLIGKPREAIFGKCDREFYDDPAIGEAINANDRRVMESGNTEVIEETADTPWGRRVYLSTKSPWRDAEGKIIGVVGVARDITGRKMMEEKLRESEASRKVAEAVEAERQRLLDVLETLPAMVCLLTPDHHVAFANRSFLEKFGESHGRHCYEYCFGKSEPCDFCESYRVLETGRPHHWEVTGPDGSVIECYDFPFTDVDGSPMILEMDIDITEHRKTEAELVAAKETAEEAVEAKAAFLANVSHELRTPMNAVIGFSNLLMDESLTPEHKDYIERIKAGGEVLLALINDILDLSKIEKGKIELEHRPISLRHLANESLDMVSVQARDEGLNLGLTMRYGTPDIIIGDHGRLRQILVNLLSNAVKFTDAGGVTLSISVSSKAGVDTKRQILFSVEDTGVGIPKDKMDLLFQPFSQVDATISSHRGGTGLGLAISRRLVELMGGRIWIESKPGKGSVFSFTIEADVEVEPRKPGGAAKGATEAALVNIAQEKPMKILVAEDNPSNQKVMVEILKRLGYRADVAGDGLEVLQALER